MAQVEFFEKSLKKAIKTAKSEDKIVILLASASWWQPCTMLELGVFPIKEVGEYINKNFVFKKLQLDVDDNENIKYKYDIKAYPTFIFLNGAGEEVSRFIGGAKSPEEFVNKVEFYASPENSYEAQEAKIKKDPKEALKYSFYLKDAGKIKESTDVLKKFLTDNPLSVIFAKEIFPAYKYLITSSDSPILTKIIENKEEIISIVGQDEFIMQMTGLGDGFVMGQLMNRDFSKKNYISIMNLISSNEFLRGEVYEFVKKNEEIVLGNNSNKLFEFVMASIRDCSTMFRYSMVNLLGNRVSKDPDCDKKMIALYTLAIDVEQDPEMKKQYSSILSSAMNSLNKPGAIKSGGVVHESRNIGKSKEGFDISKCTTW